MAAPDALGFLRAVVGRRVRTEDDGHEHAVRFEVRDSSSRAIAVELAGFGDLVTVESPDEVRRLLRRVGADPVRTYG